MFGWGELFLAFVVGMVVAVWVMAIFVRRWAERLRVLLEEALADESGKTTTSVSKEQALASDKIIPLTVEVENNLYYCYNSNTNQFVCQGSDVKELTDQFQQRFPGLNAFFNSGDEAALAVLRQQLKDNRENSNSIGSAS
jgi:hypothetical protein